jgi:hypothetical protein
MVLSQRPSQCVQRALWVSRYATGLTGHVPHRFARHGDNYRAAWLATHVSDWHAMGGGKGDGTHEASCIDEPRAQRTPQRHNTNTTTLYPKGGRCKLRLRLIMHMALRDDMRLVTTRARQFATRRYGR